MRTPAVVPTVLLLAALVQPSPAPAQETVAAEATTGRKTGIEELVVTARRREENVQDVPIAITALGGSFLQNSNLTDMSDLQLYVPGLTFNANGNSRGSGHVIRGLGTRSFSDAVEQSVGTVIDGVVMGREGMGLNDLVDIERIEVLRGPQGTLFGKNASAGLINVITKRPTDHVEAFGQILYGSFDQVQVRGSLSGPLIPGLLSGRIAAYHHQHDGLLDNPVLMEKVNDKNQSGMRMKLLFTPTDDFEILFIGDYQRDDQDCCIRTPRTRAIVSPDAIIADLINQTQDELGIIPSDTNRVAANNAQTHEDEENFGVSFEARYEMENMTLTSITAWRGWDIDEFNDADASPVNGLDRAGTTQSTDQITQEFRINGSYDDWIEYVGGFFLFYQISDSLTRFASPLLAQESTNDRDVDTLSYAGFAHVTLRPFENLSIDGGLRLTREEVDIVFDRQGTFDLALGPPLFFEERTTDTDLSGTISLRYFWTEDVMTYATYTRGYKGPATNIVAGAPREDNLDTLVIKPEIPTNYEIGVKSTWFDNRLTANLTAFWTDVENFQAESFDPATLFFQLRNAGKLRTRGFEFESMAQPIPEFTLFTSAAYIDADIRSFPGGPCYTFQSEADGCIGGQQDLAGQELPLSPDWTVSLVANYDRDLPDAVPGDLAGFVRWEFNWRDNQIFGLDQDPNTRHGSFSLSNLRLGLRDIEDKYRITFAIENVFDQDYQYFIVGPVAAFGQYTHFVGNERWFSINLQANWGGA